MNIFNRFYVTFDWDVVWLPVLRIGRIVKPAVTMQEVDLSSRAMPVGVVPMVTLTSREEFERYFGAPRPIGDVDPLTLVKQLDTMYDQLSAVADTLEGRTDDMSVELCKLYKNAAHHVDVVNKAEQVFNNPLSL